MRSVSGGLVYPIMLRQLFTKVGFAWGVRISGFITLALCTIATAMVTSNLPIGRRSGPWFDVNMFKDTRYLLVGLGSALIALGQSIILGSLTEVLTSHSRSFHSILLYRRLRDGTPCLIQHGFLCTFRDECRKHSWTSCTCMALRCPRPLQSHRSLCVPLRAALVGVLDIRKNTRLDHGLRGAIRFFLGCVQRAYHSYRLADLGCHRDWHPSRNDVQHHLISVSCVFVISVSRLTFKLVQIVGRKPCSGCVAEIRP